MEAEGVFMEEEAVLQAASPLEFLAGTPQRFLLGFGQLLIALSGDLVQEAVEFLLVDCVGAVVGWRRGRGRPGRRGGCRRRDGPARCRRLRGCSRHG